MPDRFSIGAVAFRTTIGWLAGSAFCVACEFAATLLALILLDAVKLAFFDDAGR